MTGQIYKNEFGLYIISNEKMAELVDVKGSASICRYSKY